MKQLVYQQKFLNDSTAREAITDSSFENQLENYHLVKYQQAKIIQCTRTCSKEKKNMSNTVEATIETEPFKGADVLIPRIYVISMDIPT